MAAGIYDHVIVGAGSAGCVLANRLSTDPACQVVLLAGGRAGRTGSGRSVYRRGSPNSY